MVATRSAAAFEALMWPGAVFRAAGLRGASGVWWPTGLGQPRPASQGVLRLAAAPVWSRGGVDWRLPSWSDVCAAVEGSLFGWAAEFASAPLCFLACVAAERMHAWSADGSRALEKAWIIQKLHASMSLLRPRPPPAPKIVLRAPQLIINFENRPRQAQ